MGKHGHVYYLNELPSIIRQVVCLRWSALHFSLGLLTDVGARKSARTPSHMPLSG